MASLQTRLASAAAGDAARTWDRHRGQCFTCTRAAKDRAWAAFCDEGLRLHDDKRAADVELKCNRAEDAKPIPGQGMLFGDPAHDPWGLEHDPPIRPQSERDQRNAGTR